ncbi:hypothetical protein [Kineococcus rubinsiae]|uniref:hypothetical protein n=1 Tax=Kineococcus rubinsiae TaxID=2609562 RepID=UPI0014320FD5|nr:hypothetical protein [Kineococcus rubinsiae]NIZ90813.1 hypothetical protein [Kineococcus rubinsiae]
MTRAARPGADDDGRIALLSLVFALVATLLVLVVVSASAVHLQRKRLYAVADAAAADAADAVDERRYYAVGGGLVDGAVPLTDASVRASVLAYLAGSDPGVAGVAVDPATGSPDGRTAEVVLTATLLPPFAAFVPGRFAAGVPARATSRATALLR